VRSCATFFCLRSVYGIGQILGVCYDCRGMNGMQTIEDETPAPHAHAWTPRPQDRFEAALALAAVDCGIEFDGQAWDRFCRMAWAWFTRKHGRTNEGHIAPLGENHETF